MSMAPAPDYARMTALVFTHTDPMNRRLREEIATRGRVQVAKLLTGDREIPEDLQKWENFTDWHDKLQSFDPERELARLAAAGIRFIAPSDDEWPEQLNDLEFPPFGLFVAGQGGFPDHEKTIALVGSRDATGYGLSITGDMAVGLVGRGYTVVSGGAYGIDAAAHRAALAAPSSSPEHPVPTIAVLANGLDRYYPAGNSDMLHAVSQRGLVVTESPLGSSPTRAAFLNRNRIIAALSASTVVIEARWRSGSMNTATHARKLGRRLGAVPGSVYSANSAGTHRLIREFEAQLVTDAADIVELEHFHTER